MKRTSRKYTSAVARKRRPVWPTPAQVWRQVGVILLVVAIWVVLLVGYLSLTGGSKSPAAASPQPTVATKTTTVSFSKDVLPLLKTRCEGCHGDGLAQAGLKLTSYADVMAGSTGGQVVIPGSAATSRLVELIAAGEMPQGGPQLSAAEIETIRAWVDENAPDN